MLHLLSLLLPALIPSWRFFKSVDPSPRIEYALMTALTEAPLWQEFRPRPPRLGLLQMAARLFWNPRWNEELFMVACAERLMVNPTHHSHLELLSRIAAEVTSTGGPAYLQFRLIFVERQGRVVRRSLCYLAAPEPVGDAVP